MSAKELSTLQANVEAKPGLESTIATGMEKGGTPNIPEELSILPVRGIVVFPGTIIPLNIHRAASLKLLDDTLPRTKVIGLLTQRDEAKEDPTPQDLYSVGTAALVLKLLRQEDDNVLVIVQGLRRFSLRKIVATSPFLRAEVDLPESILPPASKEWEATFRNLRDSAARLFELAPDAPEQARLMILNIENPEQLADFLAPNLNVDVAQKQALLEELDVEKRVRAIQKQISAQLEIAEIQQKLQKDVASQFSDAQRRAYLRSQIKAIQRELGEAEGGGEEQAKQLGAGLEEAKPPEEVMKQAERELKRLDFIPPASPEFSVIVSYIEIIADLPWNKLSEDNLDLDQAQKILDRDHYDLEKVKKRLIEYLAVRKLNPQGHGAILCFLGPPGVGKTSLGQSIADALGRKFVRISLGGMRDEAEIRGHRRTYIGSIPGPIIHDYPHEAGVRELERKIASVCRGIASQVARGKIEHATVTPELVVEMLGPAKYVRETRLKTSKPGVVTGLAYTPAGGEVLHIEATRYPGKGNVTLTGHIGEVMKESVQAALSLVRSRDGDIDIKPEDFRDMDIHVHVPAGAVPKDGPSAGIAMFTALASLFANKPVRSDVAMTGEITLRGLVLPIGGLKEKSLAAMRAGISTVIIPKLNEKDLADVPEEAKQNLKFVPVENVDEVLAVALENPSPPKTASSNGNGNGKD